MQNYVGQQIDRYRIIKCLGMGGMAMVYKAYDTRLERDVALKLIRIDEIPVSQHARLMKRFEREAKAQAKFSHPNIVSVHDYGEVDGSPYLVMEYIQGGTLKTRIDQPVDYVQAVRWLAPIADALRYAHQRGVIHRDVKPSNILFDEEDRPVLTDFGIAKILETDEATLTGTGMGVGTPEYMAPEQWQGKASEATDQYSLGVVLYELITGKKPYQADTPAAVAILQATEPLAPPSKLVDGVPEAVEKVLYKALARNPEDRYEDMEAFQAALEGLLIEAETREPKKRAQPKTQPKPTPEKVKSVRSEGETRDALDATPAEEIQTKDRTHQSKKRGLPRWMLWAGAGLIGVVIIIIIIVIGRGLGKGDDKPLSMLAMETYTATITPTLTQTATLTLTPTITMTPMSTLGIGSTRINEIDGAEMVYVPAGEFLMGSEDEEAYSGEAPEHMVYLDSYWIYKYEVTNEQYHACLEAGECAGDIRWYPEDDHPAVYIDWHEADAYCEWASGRLPTEAEWEKAARGTEQLIFPWGMNEPSRKLANYNNNEGSVSVVSGVIKIEVVLTPVGKYPLGGSPYGVLDMAGNAWEWVLDWYDGDYYNKSKEKNPNGPSEGKLKILRGGSADSLAKDLRTYSRYTAYPSDAQLDYGFRCVILP